MSRDTKKLSLRAQRLIQLMEQERGIPAKMAKAIGKKPSFYSEIKRGKKVNADHIAGVALVFGPGVAMSILLAIDTLSREKIPGWQVDLTKIIPGSKEDKRSGKDRRNGYEYDACGWLSEMKILDLGLFLQTAHEINAKRVALLEFHNIKKKSGPTD